MVALLSMIAELFEQTFPDGSHLDALDFCAKVSTHFGWSDDVHEAAQETTLELGTDLI